MKERNEQEELEEEKIASAVRKMKKGKAAGIDRIPMEAWIYSGKPKEWFGEHFETGVKKRGRNPKKLEDKYSYQSTRKEIKRGREITGAYHSYVQLTRYMQK